LRTSPLACSIVSNLVRHCQSKLLYPTRS